MNILLDGLLDGEKVKYITPKKDIDKMVFLSKFNKLYNDTIIKLCNDCRRSCKSYDYIKYKNKKYCSHFDDKINLRLRKTLAKLK